MQNLKFLISTSKSIFLYDEGNLKEVSSGNGVYFGLYLSNGFYYILARNNYDGSGGGANTNSLNSLIVLDNSFNQVGEIKLDFIKDGHQLFSYNNDLYICNSGLNLITRISPNGEIFNIAPNVLFGRDINHINGINFYNNKWYVCQHRKYYEEDGGISIFDEKWNFMDYIKIGKHAHDIKIKGQFLFSCDSDNGQLIQVDLTTKARWEHSISHVLMTRGLIINDKYICIGLSEYDKRDMRHGAHTARVAIYNLGDMQYLDTIEIPNVGQCNDLLLI